MYSMHRRDLAGLVRALGAEHPDARASIVYPDLLLENTKNKWGDRGFMSLGSRWPRGNVRCCLLGSLRILYRAHLVGLFQILHGQGLAIFNKHTWRMRLASWLFWNLAYSHQSTHLQFWKSDKLRCSSTWSSIVYGRNVSVGKRSWAGSIRIEVW